MNGLVLSTVDSEDTRRVAATVAGALRPGDVISLTGELGAGKTCFVQGAAAALGVTERVTSPSFLLRRDYKGALGPILHMDVYRLDTLREVLEIGYDEVGDRRSITFIEWGDAMSQLLPADHLEVELRLGPVDTPAAVDDEERRIVLHARGHDWLRRLSALAVDLQRWRAIGQ